MATIQPSITCPQCGALISAPTKTTFLGFRKATCAACGSNSTLPLTSGYRITYVVVLLGMIGAFFYIYKQGQVPLPGFIGIAVIIALVRDTYLRLRSSRSAAKTQQQ